MSARPLDSDIVAPPIGSIMAFRGVHALADLTMEGRLRATHYATCLIGGREPMWGVWLVSGKFQQFFGSKEQIKTHYPRKVWRAISATWNLIDVHRMAADEKRQEMQRLYRKGSVETGAEPVAALTEGGRIVAWSDIKGVNGSYRPLYAGAEMNNAGVVK